MALLFRRVVVFYIFALFLCGLLYPALVTGAAQILFPERAEGSIVKNGKLLLASKWIGQNVTDSSYFFGRPSATSPYPTNALASAASQAAVASASYAQTLTARVSNLQALDLTNPQAFPPDLVMASGSGLDPEISLDAALFQVGRIARLRDKAEPEIKALIDRFAEGRQLGFLGEPRVNVNLLNLALDGRI